MQEAIQEKYVHVHGLNTITGRWGKASRSFLFTGAAPVLTDGGTGITSCRSLRKKDTGYSPWIW